MKNILISIFLVFFIQNVQSQKENNNWILGHNRQGIDTSKNALFKIDFGTQPFEFRKYKSSETILPRLSNCPISNSEGALLLFSDGVSVYDSTMKAIKNGKFLPSNSTFHTSFPSPQGVLLLPFPAHSDSIILLTGDLFVFDYPPGGGLAGGDNNLSYSVIDIKANDGSPEMVERKTILLTDTFPGGMKTAVKHANGRDWWALQFLYDKNEYHPVLFTPQGPVVFDKKLLEGDTYTSSGQSAFSPDGKWYARYNVVGPPKSGGYIDIYKFDRCTGVLDDPLNKKIAGVLNYGGIAFSPDSRFVYAAAFDSIFQFDLEVADILESQTLVAVYDSFTHALFPFDTTSNAYAPTRFFHMQLAPDNKIYISVPNINTRYIHTIENPNAKGLACDVRQHSTVFPVTVAYTLPNHPNYNLGPLEGSPCDTLIFTSTKLPMQTGPDISIYPNPTRDVFQYSASEQVSTLQIFNELGQLVLKKQIDQQEGVVRVAHLSEGIYVYSFWNADGEMVGRGRLVKVE